MIGERPEGRRLIQRKKLFRPGNLVLNALTGWVGTTPEFKVLKAIVGSYAILMVDSLLLTQRSADVPLHHQTVNSNHPVAVGARAFGSVDPEVTIARAGDRLGSTIRKSPTVVTGDVGHWASPEMATLLASGAGDASPSPTPTLTEPERQCGRVWPDGSGLTTGCAHGLELVGGQVAGVLVGVREVGANDLATPAGTGSRRLLGDPYSPVSFTEPFLVGLGPAPAFAKSHPAILHRGPANTGPKLEVSRGI